MDPTHRWRAGRTRQQHSTRQPPIPSRGASRSSHCELNDAADAAMRGPGPLRARHSPAPDPGPGPHQAIDCLADQERAAGPSAPGRPGGPGVCPVLDPCPSVGVRRTGVSLPPSAPAWLPVGCARASARGVPAVGGPPDGPVWVWCGGDEPMRALRCGRRGCFPIKHPALAERPGCASGRGDRQGAPKATRYGGPAACDSPKASQRAPLCQRKGAGPLCHRACAPPRG